MGKEPSYGELAFNSWKRLRNDSQSAVWDNQSNNTQDIWEAIAAIVLAEYHKRQLALGHQSDPSWLRMARERLAEAQEQADALAEPTGIVGHAFIEFIRDNEPSRPTPN